MSAIHTLLAANYRARAHRWAGWVALAELHERQARVWAARERQEADRA